MLLSYGPLPYMRSVVDRNVVMRHVPVLPHQESAIN